MQFLINPKLNFVAYKTQALTLSAFLIILSIASLTFWKLNFSIDFTGGTLIEVNYPQPANLTSIRGLLDQSGFPNAQVQHFGTAKDVLIRLQHIQQRKEEGLLSSQILDILKKYGEPVVKRVEYVGPQVGSDLRDDGGLAIIYALAGILIYVAFRFELRFALAAVLALVHDVVITLGFFSLTQIEFGLPTLAAILAVIGYSLNDTIVLYDRIRETFIHSNLPPEKVINLSINRTLARTLVTSLTTLLALIAMLIIGKEALGSFSFALITGVIIGTYSSIYIASTFVLILGVKKANLVSPPKEGEEFGGV